MNENIDLTKILKDCPKGWKFWSKTFGEVTFCQIYTIGYRAKYPIQTEDYSSCIRTFTKDGKMSEQHQGECILVPSKDQQDWSKFSAPWYKKEKFDPKTLKSFDKVICRNGLNVWHCDLFSSFMETWACPYVCISGSYTYCIPYNDDTKHLVGTNDDAPEYYEYWVD